MKGEPINLTEKLVGTDFVLSLRIICAWQLVLSKIWLYRRIHLRLKKQEEVRFTPFCLEDVSHICSDTAELYLHLKLCFCKVV